MKKKKRFLDFSRMNYNRLTALQYVLCLFLLIGARSLDETVVNHKTKQCIRFHRGDACTPCRYTIQKGWGSVEGNLCPKDYENLTDQFEKKIEKGGSKKDFENYLKVQKQAVKCNKPRKVPKCCNEPPFCS